MRWEALICCLVYLTKHADQVNYKAGKSRETLSNQRPANSHKQKFGLAITLKAEYSIAWNTLFLPYPHC